MHNDIFRQKSLDKVQSPEKLDEYIRVTSPGVWLLLVSIIVLLIGACVWGVFGHIDRTVPAAVHMENGQAICYIADTSALRVGLTVRFAEGEARIAEIGEQTDRGYRCTLSDTFSLPDGIYEGKVITESFSPLSFILN